MLKKSDGKESIDARVIDKLDSSEMDINICPNNTS